MTTAPPRPSPSAELPGHPRFPAPAAASHRVRYAVVGLVLVGALVFLVVKGLGTALNFYLPANQAVAQQAIPRHQDVQSRGSGRAELGPRHPARGGLRGHLGSTRVAVDNTGTPPELFQADIPVIAVGHFRGSTFVSDQILVKHSSDLHRRAPGPGHRPERHQAMIAGPNHRRRRLTGRHR